MPDKSWQRKAGSGGALAVLSTDDWEREQETLYVLQNNSLMKQIADSMVTHNTRVADQENRRNCGTILLVLDLGESCNKTA